MTSMIIEKFATQLAPLADESSIMENILRRVEDDQTSLQAELRSIDTDQFNIDIILSKIVAGYDAKKREKRDLIHVRILSEALSEKGKGKRGTQQSDH